MQIFFFYQGEHVILPGNNTVNICFDMSRFKSVILTFIRFPETQASLIFLFQISTIQIVFVIAGVFLVLHCCILL